MLRCHGRWIFTENAKKFWLAVQIEKTEINILQINWGGKAFLPLFKIKKKKLFLNLINPLRRVDTSNLDIPPVVKCNVNCSVIIYLCTRTVLGLVVWSQASFFLSNFLYVRTKTQENFLPIFVFEEAENGEHLVKPTGRASNKIFDSDRPWVAL